MTTLDFIALDLTMRFLVVSSWRRFRWNAKRKLPRVSYPYEKSFLACVAPGSLLDRMLRSSVRANILDYRKSYDASLK